MATRLPDHPITRSPDSARPLDASFFPHTDTTIYLDHAATGPPALPVLRAVEEYLHGGWDVEARLQVDGSAAERARSRAAQLINAPYERVELAPSTTFAICLLAQGFDWRPGDHVILPACEFPANAMPWLALRERGVNVELVPDRRGVVTAEELAARITPRTRLVAVSWVQFLSGYTIDLATLIDAAHSRGAFVAVDAIQGLGALAMDVTSLDIDYLAAGAQKWLLGMQGAAFLYITESLQERVAPMRGWMNGPTHLDHLTDYDGALYPDARRYRITAPAMANVVAFDASLGMILDAGPTEIERRVVARAVRLADGLDRLGLRRYGPDTVASGIVTVDHAQPDRLRAELRSAGVHVAVREEKLRFSPHGYNTDDDIDAAIEALACALRR